PRQEVMTPRSSATLAFIHCAPIPGGTGKLIHLNPIPRGSRTLARPGISTLRRRPVTPYSVRSAGAIQDSVTPNGLKMGRSTLVGFAPLTVTCGAGSFHG